MSVKNSLSIRHQQTINHQFTSCKTVAQSKRKLPIPEKILLTTYTLSQLQQIEYLLKQFPGSYSPYISCKQITPTLSGESMKKSTGGLKLAAMVAALGCLNISSGIAQTSVNTQPDNEACQAMNDSTALDQQSIETRITCYSSDAQHLNQLIQQLIQEREQLTTRASENSKKNIVKENVYVKELAKRQESLQRLEERSANLTVKIDAITKERDDIREQLFSALSQSKDNRIDVEANQKLFRNFSQTYIALNTQIDELQKKLEQAENSNRQLSDQKEAQKIANDEQSEQLQSSISSLELSLAELKAETLQLQADLAEANNRQASMKNQLLQSAEVTLSRVEQIASLSRSVNDSEKETLGLKEEIKSINQTHLLDTNKLNNEAEVLNQKVSALNNQLASFEDQAKQNQESAQAAIDARDKEISELIESRQVLGSQRETLLAKTTALEDTHFKTEKRYKTQTDALENKITALNAEKAALDRAIKDLKTDNDTLTTEQARLTAQRTELSASVEQNEKERARLARELDVVKPELQSAQQRLSSLTQKNKSLESDIQTLERQLQQAAADKVSLNESLTTSKQNSNLTREKLTSLEKDASALKTLLSLSRAHSENADKTLAVLRTEIKASNERLSEKEKILKDLIAEQKRIEANLQARASKSKSEANAIHRQLLKAGHKEVTVDVDDNDNIGILLGSGQLFRTGSAWLSNDGKAVLTDLAATFNLARDRRIEIIGHSDNVPLGEKLSAIFKDNWGLSMARALATANFFTDDANIVADRMTVSGLGATQPIAGNDTPQGRQQNRRVEIKLVPNSAQIASAQ